MRPINLQTIQQRIKFRIQNQKKKKKKEKHLESCFPKFVHGINIPPPAHNHISATVFKLLLPLPLRIATFGRDQLNRSTNPPRN